MLSYGWCVPTKIKKSQQGNMLHRSKIKTKAYKTNQPLVNRSGNFGISGIYFLICGNKYTPLLSKFSSIILY